MVELFGYLGIIVVLCIVSCIYVRGCSFILSIGPSIHRIYTVG